MNNAALGLDDNGVLGGQSLIMHEAHEAARAVAALFYLAAIGVKDAIAEVSARRLRRLDQQQLIKADAGMAIAQRTDLFRGQFDILTHAVDHDEVVAEAVHFGKFQAHNRYNFLASQPSNRCNSAFYWFLAFHSVIVTSNRSHVSTDDRPASRRIAHLDMDAFFASVELLDYPELRGHPVVVGGRNVPAPKKRGDGNRTFARLRDYVGRGVATTATYEARALGVFSGMGLMKSARLAPDAFLLPANFAAYREYSQRFKQAVASVAPIIEDRGIDEIYIDLSNHPDDSLAIARRIKQAISDATGLSCSIGITPNKLLSKIASDLDKPDGITLLSMADLPERIWPLPAKRINGIGPKVNERLAKLGIHTIGQIAATPPDQLIRHFGQNTGIWLYNAAHGIDERPVETSREPKSFSRETTFQQDLHVQRDRAELGRIFTDLCQRVAEDLKRKGYVGKTIGIKIRFADFKTVTRDITIDTMTDDAAVIRQTAGSCLKRIALSKPIRLLGIRVSSVVERHQVNDLIRQNALPL